MRLVSCVFVLAALTLSSIVRAATDSAELSFGIISTEASSALKQQWAPVIADLETQTGLRMRPFFASDYAGIIEAMRFNKVQVAYFGNKSAMEAVDRAEGEIFAQAIQASGRPGYYSLLITHKDSDIHSLEDVLRSPGKYSFANGDPNSTSGSLVPGYYVFALNHIDPKAHFRRMVTGSHEANIMAVLNRQVDLATNNSNDMEKLGRELGPRINDIRIVWTSPLIPADPLVWRRDLSPEIKDKLSSFFTLYGKSGAPAAQEAARKALATLTFAGFRASNNDQLLPIRQLELFKDRARIDADSTLSATLKSSRLADLDAQLEDLRRRIAAAAETAK